MYKIIVLKDDKEIYNCVTETCDINEQRSVVPIFKTKQETPFTLAPSNRVNFSIKGYRTVELDSEYYTII